MDNITAAIDQITDAEALDIAIVAIRDRTQSFLLAERTAKMMGVNTPAIVRRDIKRLRRLRIVMGKLEQMKARFWTDEVGE